MKIFIKSLFLVAAAGLGLANQIPNITAPPLPSNLPTPDPISLLFELSPQCQGAFLGIVANPEFFQCVPVAALLPVITDPTLLPGIMSDPIGNFPKLIPIIEAVCEVPKCSDEGVAASLKGLQEGCSSPSDLANPITQIGLAVLTFYSPVRDIMCFKNFKDELCVADTLNTLTHLPKPPTRLLDGGFLDEVIFGEPKFFCTPCNKAIINTAINFLNATPQAFDILEKAFHVGPEEVLLIKFGIAAKCGFQFEDGKVNDPTVDPSKFEYQVADANEKKGDAANVKALSLVTAGSLCVATYFMV